MDLGRSGASFGSGTARYGVGARSLLVVLVFVPMLRGDVAPYPPEREEPEPPEVLTPKAIEASIGQNPDALGCFEEHPPGEPGTDAIKVWVKFSVMPTGQVFGARVVSPDDLHGTELAGCLTAALERVAFPPLGIDQPRTVKYPFVVRPPAESDSGGGSSLADLPPAGPGIPGPPILEARVGSSPAIKSCFTEAQAEGQPGLEPGARIWARFTVTPDGRVSDADLVTDTVAGTPLDTCVSGALERLVFPPFSGEESKTVKYPFVLRDPPAAD